MILFVIIFDLDISSGTRTNNEFYWNSIGPRHFALLRLTNKC
jgi:hypothetical protein